MSKICNKCGTENEDKFSYCKNCGNPLNSTASNFSRTEKPFNSNEFNYCDNTVLPEIDGISSKDFSVFVGKNSQKILSKFSKMQLTDSKISWCWPVAVLSLLLGVAGAGLWFCYRKMYKLGAVLIAAGIIISTAVSVVTGVAVKNVSSDVADSASKYFTFDFEDDEEIIVDDQEIIDFINDFLDSFQQNAGKSKIYTIFIYITSLIKPAAFVFFGIFSMYFYKKHCIKKIKMYREKNQQNEYYYYGLSAMGGTSGAAVVLCVVVWMLLSSVANNIIFSSTLLDFFSDLRNYVN